MIKSYNLGDVVDPAHRHLPISGTLTCPSSAIDRIRVMPLGASTAPRDYRIALTADHFAGSVTVGMGEGTGTCIITSAGPLVTRRIHPGRA